MNSAFVWASVILCARKSVRAWVWIDQCDAPVLAAATAASPAATVVRQAATAGSVGVGVGVGLAEVGVGLGAAVEAGVVVAAACGWPVPTEVVAGSPRAAVGRRCLVGRGHLLNSSDRRISTRPSLFVTTRTRQLPELRKC
ncbi:MAG TPA: hypothetical protein VIM10_11000 [Actinopolymorphaceae bacterium]